MNGRLMELEIGLDVGFNSASVSIAISGIVRINLSNSVLTVLIV